MDESRTGREGKILDCSLDIRLWHVASRNFNQVPAVMDCPSDLVVHVAVDVFLEGIDHCFEGTDFVLGRG
ncbi:hypothetical protein E2C01_101028 [Portunus trituberculatus]|uniref:Uncharacterized protein n=1 Tax=Portunus trituberculatus TaxID=210409 RepID=A0A5B7KEU1_PORTR|nr:hypothetical protein [Portunus trituberculatus]